MTSERLATVGVDVPHHQAVGDNIPRIVEALKVALGRADVVVVTGGLGPTEDDLRATPSRNSWWRRWFVTRRSKTCCARSSPVTAGATCR